MDSTWGQSGDSLSAVEVSALTGSSRQGEQDDFNIITFIVIAFCVLALILSLVVAILFTRNLETYDESDDAGGRANDDTRFPRGRSSSSSSGSGPPATVKDTFATTEVPAATMPGRAPQTTREVPPMPPSIPAAKPTASQLTSSAMERVTTTPTTPSSLLPTPPRKQSSIKPQSLLCTFGNKTNYGTIFPADGVCDYIFYDSMYKNNKNPLVANWDYDVYSILSKAQKTDKKKTQFGLGFAFEHRRRLVEDLVNSSLEVFWGHNVFHFGILDCPGHKTKQADMDEVFVALQTLDAAVLTARASGNTSYIVLGAVSHTDDWNEYFKSKFGSVFTPDLFISVSHQFHGDPERINCSATPPTIVKKPQGLYDAHDLYDATRALVSIASIAGGPRLSLSLSMKGRWSTLLSASPATIFSACETLGPGPFFGSYTEVCNTPPFSTNIVYELPYHTSRAFDPGTRRMLAYEDEKSVRQKLCFAKANQTAVAFGVAVYDLDYEDADNTCANQNTNGAYSRLQTARTVAKYLANEFIDASKLAECSKVSR
ncbi:hypothetical protein HPB51_018409 [Rhipicephalus microplus]|uniref:Uncharacterized protein n=1 Tax=Rhipicephalus microplus TaxID=6941 RepID=A0A9J6EU39_RHIMP|nr:hypothetical protein HPB51_018409 [Rhipicephalus microplus]